jgi:hypothetical protein
MHVSVTRNKLKEARLEIVGRLYKRGYSYSEIAKEVTKRLNLEKAISKQTVFNDCTMLLAEWKAERVQNVDDAIQKELAIIDEMIKVLWDAWEKSVLDQDLKATKKKGELLGGSKISTKEIEEQVKHEINYGDVRYIAEIRANLIERRKLLGLYSAEKREITGKDGGAIETENKTTIDYTKIPDEALLAIVNASK